MVGSSPALIRVFLESVVKNAAVRKSPQSGAMWIDIGTLLNIDPLQVE
jgi:hypothetical protein